MLYNVDPDLGNRIDGYIIPDGFSEQAEFLVYDGTVQVYHGYCDVVHEAVVHSGRHETGLVGFSLDEVKIPNLSQIADLSIVDAKSNLLIYSRTSEINVVHKNVFRLETQFAPLMDLDKSLSKHFCYSVMQLDRFGHETTLQYFYLTHYLSSYASGRILIKNYEMILDTDFVFLTTVNNPYIEMAIRFVTICNCTKYTFGFMTERDRLIFAPAIEYFSDLNLRDEEAIRAHIKNAPKDVLSLFASPVTRQLVCKTPEENANYRSVSTALNMLSRFDLVDQTEGKVKFADSVSELFNVPAASINDKQNMEVFKKYAEVLKSIPLIDAILESDLILYHYIQATLHKVDTDRPHLS